MSDPKTTPEDDEEYEVLEDSDPSEDEEPIVETPEETLDDGTPIEDTPGGYHEGESQESNLFDTLEKEAGKPDRKLRQVEDLNDTKLLQKKVNAIKFFNEYVKDTTRKYPVIADKLGLSRETGRNYLNEFITVVKDAIELNSYPLDVLSHYNDNRIPKEKRLRIYHLNALRPVVLLYGKYNIDSAIRDRTADRLLDTFSGAQGQEERLPNINPLSQPQEEFSTPVGVGGDSDGLHVNMTAIQVWRYILRTMGRSTPDVKKFTNAFMIQPEAFTKDKALLRNLLKNIINMTSEQCNMAFELFKRSALYLARGEAFEEDEKLKDYEVMQSKDSRRLDITSFDPFIQELYRKEVFDPFYPPEHPINQENWKEYKRRKSVEKEEEGMQKQMKNMMNTYMLKSMDTMAIGGGQNGGQNPVDPMMQMVMMGYLRPEVITREDGTQITRYVPAGQPMGMQQTQASAQDNLKSTLELVREVLAIARPPAQEDSVSNQLMQMFVATIGDKMKTDPTEAFMRNWEMMKQMNMGMGGGASRAPSIEELKYQLEKDKLVQEKDIAMQQMGMEERKLNIEVEREKVSEETSNKNAQEFMQGLFGLSQMFSPIVQTVVSKLILGNNGAPSGPMPGGMMDGMGGPGMPPGGMPPWMMGQGMPPQQPQGSPQTLSHDVDSTLDNMTEIENMNYRLQEQNLKDQNSDSMNQVIVDKINQMQAQIQAQAEVIQGYQQGNAPSQTYAGGIYQEPAQGQGQEEVNMPPKSYNVNDFKDKSPEELMLLREQIENTEKEVNSFKTSLNQALAESDMYQGGETPTYEYPIDSQQQEGYVDTGQEEQQEENKEIRDMSMDFEAVDNPNIDRQELEKYNEILNTQGYEADDDGLVNPMLEPREGGAEPQPEPQAPKKKGKGKAK